MNIKIINTANNNKVPIKFQSLTNISLHYQILKMITSKQIKNYESKNSFFFDIILITAICLFLKIINLFCFIYIKKLG